MKKTIPDYIKDMFSKGAEKKIREKVLAKDK
jgi:hypothetical protein